MQRDRRREHYSWTEIDPTDVAFRDHEPLGSGAFSTVRLANWKGSSVAVKIMNDSNRASHDIVRALRAEVRVHESLHHEFITHLYGACTIKPNLWLVMEYARNGSLDQYLRASRRLLDDSLQVALLSDIANGMCFLHGRGVLHRDLKSHNVLVYDNSRLKLCDFGLAQVRQGNAVASNSGGKGTIGWMAPEVLKNEDATEKSDLYR